MLTDDTRGIPIIGGENFYASDYWKSTWCEKHLDSYPKRGGESFMYHRFIKHSAQVEEIARLSIIRLWSTYHQCDAYYTPAPRLPLAAAEH